MCANLQGKLIKGSHVIVKGKLKTRQWDDKGTVKYITEVVVNYGGSDCIILDKKDQENKNYNIENKEKYDYTDLYKGKKPNYNNSYSVKTDIIDDDIPF
jgi:single-stranded DNA-binding protein